MAGRYEIAASLKADGKLLANQAGELRVRGADLELVDSGTRPDNLKAIKEATGGVYVDIDDADEIAAKIARVERRRSSVSHVGWCASFTDASRSTTCQDAYRSMSSVL